MPDSDNKREFQPNNDQKQYGHNQRSGDQGPKDPLAEKGPGSPTPEQHPPYSQLWVALLSWLLVISSAIYLWSNVKQIGQPKIPYSVFKQELRKNNIQRVLVKEGEISGDFRVAVSVRDNSIETDKQFKTYLPSFGDEQLMRLLEENRVEIVSEQQKTPLWISIILSTAPWLVLIAFFIYSSRALRNTLSGGEGKFGFSKSKARQIEAKNISTRYADVAGLESAKRDLQEIIGYLKDPEHYRRLGAKMPKGILMMGPPGCGKTLLARATAGEAGVPFFTVSGSEFIEMFVGVGASRVRNMFADARKQAPALIFIDEIDSVGRVRGTGLGGGNDEREQTLNQILAEMDGFSSEEAVVVLAATNRPDVLDPALLRPGRFDRKLVLELPGRVAREEILKVHTRKVPLAETVDLAVLAAQTVGFSGADLANLVNEAALRAARHDQSQISVEDFEHARDKIVMGNTLTECLTDDERQRVAFHEAGHALAAYYSPLADPINKISIVPRGRSLGMTEQIPLKDRHNYTQQYLEERLSILLGGRCAELLEFEQVSSGAADDLKQATHLARQMVTQWGMSERIGPVNLQQSEEHPFLGREITEEKKFSERSAQIIDEEVSALIKRCSERTSSCLTEHREQLSMLAQALLDKESVSGEQMDQLIKASGDNN